MNNMLLYFNFENRIFEYHLPAVNNRRIVVNLRGRGTDFSCELFLEVWDNIWYAKSSKDISLTQNGEKYNLFMLVENTILDGYIEESDQEFSMLVMEQNSDVTLYRKYSIRNKQNIEIGKSDDMDIVIDNPYVSKLHATIYKKDGKTFIKDSGKNGTFVNTERLLAKRELCFLDEIYIVGVKLIYLGDILAINHTEEVFSHLSQVEMRTLSDNILEEKVIDSYFSRAPRNMEPLDKEVVEIEGPPSGHKEKKQPMLFTLGPSLTMPIPMVLSVMINMNMQSGTSNPMMYFGTLISVVCSAVIGAGWAIAHQKYDKKSREDDEQNRQVQYTKYIENCETLLNGKHQYNKQLLEEQYLDTKELCHVLDKYRSRLWNRNLNHDDFMTVRIGKGKILYPGQILIPKEHFTLDEDSLGELPHQLYEKYSYMQDAVATIDLRKDKIVGVIGEYKRILSIMQTIVVQIAATHCYTDVKMAFLATEYEIQEMEWVKWLPHFFSQDRKTRYIACEENSLQNVSYVLTEELRNRQEQMEANHNSFKVQTHYVVFCTIAEWIEKEALYSYMISTQNYGFTFVLLYGEMDRLPNECVRIIQCDNAYSGSYLLTEEKTDSNRVEFDHINPIEAENFAKSISGVFVNETAGGDIPTSIDFMEMMQIPKLESWDLMRKYKENRVYEGIKALVGLTYGNKPMYLDIHEKRFGPHGLVAGTTGSGKSETLMTFILSLAMNYHPDEVAFVLIDYKGGGMALPFMGMPHIAGTITNIGDGTERVDETQTRRALISIRSEIRRRQVIFSQYGVNHIDSYIRLYRDGEANEPLPHLIIISDEFAELKKEQPEFIKELVSTARVGRSLGIHLILATQKPSGVVDDEIWSNSRFKICLRVQDKQDSIGMLKRPEAAYITGIGRAYMQIGNDEIFEMFQSGYAGANYEPSEEMVLSQHNEVSMIGIDGHKLVKSIKRVKSDAETQLNACVEYIKNVAENNGIKSVKPLWLPILSNEIYVDDLYNSNKIDFSDGIKAIVGLVDEPEQQKQIPAVLELDKISSLLLVGNVGMGKTTFLHTLIYSLVTQYGPEDIQFYAMDFSSRTLRLTQRLPHCGGVAFVEEAEKIERILQMLLSIIEERKSIFETAGVGGYKEYLYMKRIPMIILIIDNYDALKNEYQKHEATVMQLIREGFQYGIQVIITANGVGDIGLRNAQNIGKTIALYLGDKSRYFDVVHTPLEFSPQNISGRGIWETDHLAEFQTALAVNAPNEKTRNEILKQIYVKLAEENKDCEKAKLVRIIPRQENYATFVGRYGSEDGIPIGYNEKTLSIEVLDLKKTFCYVISGRTEKSIQICMNNLKTYANKKQIKSFYVGDNGDLDINSYKNRESLALAIREIFKERSIYRKELLKEMDENRVLEMVIQKYPPVFVFIQDLGIFINAVYRKTDDNQSVSDFFEEIFDKGKGFGIYFFVGMRPSSYNDIIFNKLGRRILDYETNIHFGGKLGEQKLVSTSMSLAQSMIEFDYNIGSFTKKGKYIQIYMPWDEVEEA